MPISPLQPRSYIFVEEIGIVAAIRVSGAELALFAAETVNEAGIPIAEITLTVPGTVQVIAKLKIRYPVSVVGAETVLDVETAKRCIDAGARFLTSPLVPEVVEFAEERCGHYSWHSNGTRSDCAVESGS